VITSAELLAGMTQGSRGAACLAEEWRSTAGGHVSPLVPLPSAASNELQAFHPRLRQYSATRLRNIFLKEPSEEGETPYCAYGILNSTR